MTQNGDYKYAMQDSITVFIGAKYQFDELEEDLRVPVKLIAAIRSYLTISEQKGISIESYFYALDQGDQAYYLWKHLHIKMKFQSLFTTQRFHRDIYQSECLSFEEGMKRIKEDPNKERWFLTEIQVSKMRLSMVGS